MHFNKHKFENNKNQQSLKEIEDRLSSTKRVFKNHTRAKKGTERQIEMNPAIEGLYHAVIARAKPLFASLPDKHDRVIIQLNHKQEPLDPIGLFSIMTSTFFFYLECDIMGDYRIEYLFNHCPIERELKKLIDEMSLRSWSTEAVHKKDYPSFFNECLRCQPERFITLL